MASVRRVLWRLSCPTQVLQAVLAVRLLRALSCSFEDLWGCRLYSFSGQTVPVCNCLQDEKDFPYIQMKSFTFQLKPFVPCILVIFHSKDCLWHLHCFLVDSRELTVRFWSCLFCGLHKPSASPDWEIC